MKKIKVLKLLIGIKNLLEYMYYLQIVFIICLIPNPLVPFLVLSLIYYVIDYSLEIRIWLYGLYRRYDRYDHYKDHKKIEMLIDKLNLREK